MREDALRQGQGGVAILVGKEYERLPRALFDLLQEEFRQTADRLQIDGSRCF
jgi:hypothetical protein